MIEASYVSKLCRAPEMSVSLNSETDAGDAPPTLCSATTTYGKDISHRRNGVARAVDA